jgi:hypothetical protein
MMHGVSLHPDGSLALESNLAKSSLSGALVFPDQSLIRIPQKNACHPTRDCPLLHQKKAKGFIKLTLRKEPRPSGRLEQRSRRQARRLSKGWGTPLRMGRKRHQMPLKAVKATGMDKFILLPTKAVPGAFTGLIEVIRVDGQARPSLPPLPRGGSGRISRGKHNRRDVRQEVDWWRWYRAPLLSRKCAKVHFQ